jgi:hypothetical protein
MELKCALSYLCCFVKNIIFHKKKTYWLVCFIKNYSKKIELNFRVGQFFTIHYLFIDKILNYYSPFKLKINSKIKIELSQNKKK